TLASPPVGVRNPARIFRSVLFPHPDGPTRATNSPGAMSIEVGASAVTRFPSRLRKVISRSRVMTGFAVPICTGLPPAVVSDDDLEHRVDEHPEEANHDHSDQHHVRA